MATERASRTVGLVPRLTNPVQDEALKPICDLYLQAFKEFRTQRESVKTQACLIFLKNTLRLMGDSPYQNLYQQACKVQRSLDEVLSLSDGT